MYDRLSNFEEPIKKLANIDNKINIIIDDYIPKIKTEYNDINRVASTFQKIRNSMLVFYAYPGIFSKLTKKYQPQRLDKALSEYSNSRK